MDVFTKFKKVRKDSTSPVPSFDVLLASILSWPFASDRQRVLGVQLPTLPGSLSFVQFKTLLGASPQEPVPIISTILTSCKLPVSKADDCSDMLDSITPVCSDDLLEAIRLMLAAGFKFDVEKTIARLRLMYSSSATCLEQVKILVEDFKVAKVTSKSASAAVDQSIVEVVRLAEEDGMALHSPSHTTVKVFELNLPY
jgi:hypothetical protein